MAIFRATATQREMKALAIVGLENQIQRINTVYYKVKSQSSDIWYEVRNHNDGQGWKCSCPDFIFRKVECKHILSVFLSKECGLRERSTGQFTGTRRFMITFLLIASVLAVSDRFFSEPTISLLINLENTLIPLLVLSVSFDAFYATKVIAGRRWMFPDVVITLSISVLAFAISIFMIYNGNRPL